MESNVHIKYEGVKKLKAIILKIIKSRSKVKITRSVIERWKFLDTRMRHIVEVRSLSKECLCQHYIS